MFSKEQLEQDFQIVAKCSDKNERLAWGRKRKKMDEIVKKLQPLEDAILEIVKKKEPILEELRELRELMTRECVHLEEFLVHHGGYILCKFCDARLAVNRNYLTNKDGK